MDYVFIDTNIIKKEQYFKPGNKIQTLKSLALKNMIGLVTTEITINEIKANLYADLTFELECISLKSNVLYIKIDKFRSEVQKMLFITLHVKHFPFNYTALCVFSTKSLPLHPIL